MFHFAYVFFFLKSNGSNYRPVEQREFDHQIPWYKERINIQSHPLILTCAEHMSPTQDKL